MARNVISLSRGSRVGCNGAAWIVEGQEDFERVLARHVVDGRREFLRVADLTRAPSVVQQSAAGSDDQVSSAVAEISMAVDTTQKASGRWLNRLGSRQIRVLRQAPDAKAPHPKALRDAIKEFQEICLILEAPRGSARRKLIGELAARRGYTLATAYRRTDIIKLNPCAEALLRSVRSDAGTLRLTTAQQAVMRSRLDELRFVPEYQSIPQILVLVNGDLRRQGQKEISQRELYLFEKTLKTRKQVLEARGKKDEARDQYGSRAGVLPEPDWPLAIIQIDHTTLQIIFVDEEMREPLADAWLTLVIDCFSRMVLGYYVSFDAGSAASAGIALARSFLPKDEHLQRLNVQGEWPCWGYPSIIIADNAADLNGFVMKTAAKRERFDIRNRPVNFPKFGGHIESAFKTFMGLRKSVKGTKFANPTERGQYDSKANAGMTLTEFDQLFTEFLVNDYHLAEHSGHGMKRRAPLQRWRAGIFDGDIFPPTGLPDVPDDPELVFIAMLPVEYRAVKNMTVEIFTERYFSHDLARLSDRIDVEAPLAARLHEIRYDPRNIAVIWVLNPDTGTYLAAKVQNVDWDFLSLWEHTAIRKRWGEPAAEFNEQRYESKLRQQALMEESVRKTKLAKATRKKVAQEARNRVEALTKPELINAALKGLPEEPKKMSREEARRAANPPAPRLRLANSDDLQ